MLMRFPANSSIVFKDVGFILQIHSSIFNRIRPFSTHELHNVRADTVDLLNGEGRAHRGRPREGVVHGRTYKWGCLVELTCRAHGRHHCSELQKVVSYNVVPKLWLSGMSSLNYSKLINWGTSTCWKKNPILGKRKPWPGWNRDPQGEEVLVFIDRF